MSLAQNTTAVCGGCSATIVGTYVFPINGVDCEWPLGARVVLYVVLLLYLFLGVAMASDAFMGAIESITSATRTV